jgi:hypothetical protein
VPGVVAVALGGSRATDTHRPDSDWDVGVYYRGAFDPADVRALGLDGEVSELGEWGPIVNGGAWLNVEGESVDLLFRDLDVVEHWTAEAQEGRYEVLMQNGTLVGAPTYQLTGELALCRPLHGELPRPGFPEALAAAAPPRWQARAQVCLMFAAQHERRGDHVARAGMLASAVLCAAHAQLAGRREWVLNEKRLVSRAGFEGAQALESVQAVAEAIGVEPLSAR